MSSIKKIILFFTLRQYAFGAFIVFASVFDPFGLSSSSEKASADWLNRVFSSQYGHLGQKNTVVVLIDDSYLQRNNSYWPMPYGEQSKLFKRLLAYKPAAVFVDLLYSHDHSRGDPKQSSQLLTNVFERYKRQGIPLFLANTGQQRKANGSINVLSNFAGIASPALVTWSGYSDRYPLAVKTPEGVIGTPAFQLYRQFCHVRNCEGLPATDIAAAQAPAVAVQWGLNLSLQQAQVANIGHCKEPGVFSQLIQAVFWKMSGLADANCPYTLTISASDLDATSAEDRELLTQLLTNKLVLVGANITSTGDIVQSPLHGKIPGVYLHAMALDNLITLGEDYQRDPAILAYEISWLDLCQLLFLALIVTLTVFHNRCLALEDRSAYVRLLANPCVLVALTVAPILMCSVFLYANSYTPANVLAVFLLSLAIIKDNLASIFKQMRRLWASAWLCLLVPFISRREETS